MFNCNATRPIEVNISSFAATVHFCTLCNIASKQTKILKHTACELRGTDSLNLICLVCFGWLEKGLFLALQVIKHLIWIHGAPLLWEPIYWHIYSVPTVTSLMREPRRLVALVSGTGTDVTKQNMHLSTSIMNRERKKIPEKYLDYGIVNEKVVIRRRLTVCCRELSKRNSQIVFQIKPR